MLVISDSNIFIDMEVSGLTRHMFRLPETLGTPNILFDEELLKQHPELPTLGLQILDLKPEYMALADQWRDNYQAPTMNDLFAMSLAVQMQCPLLTGDKRLRNAAEREKIEVHGTLWLIERMFVEGIIKIKRVELAYESMAQSKRRLPWDMVERQLKQLKK